MVSVIVPYIDGGLAISRRFIESVVRSVKRAKQPVQLIFAGASTDGTTEGLRTLAKINSNVLLEISVKENRTGNTCYASNVNLGVQYAKYDVLLICNNDVVLPEPFFDVMLYSLSYLVEAFDRRMVPIAPGVLGPLSNKVMSHQLARVPDLDKSFSVEVLENVNKQLIQGNRPPVFASFVSGFCMMVPKKLFIDLDGFDTQFENGNEDVDFCMRALELGFGSYVIPSCFVYHEGSFTMDLIGKDKFDGGTWNRHLLAAKHWPEWKKYKIACGLRVKAPEKELKFWFDKNFKLYECIYVVDDGCEVDWRALEEYYKSKRPDFRLKVDTSMKGEKEPYQRIRYTELARKDGMDAIVNLDHDEFFEPKVSNGYLQRLLNLPVPGGVSYNGPMLHLWNSKNAYRVGYPPTKHTFLTKLIKGLNHSFVAASKSSFHCSRLPVTPIVGTVPTGLRVLHYGYMNPEERKKKREWYEAKDDVKNPQLIGNVDYSHMVDERMVRLNEWTGNSDDYTVILNTMFDNERPHHLQIFFENFASVVDCIYARTSRLDTELCEIARRFGVKIFKKKWRDDYSEARNFVLKKSRGKAAYVWFADPDERYVDPQEIIELLQVRPLGIMFAVNNYHPKLGVSFSESVRVFKNIPELVFEGRVHESVEFSIKKYEKSPLILRAKHKLDHYGFMWSDLEKKLEYYEKLNLEALQEDPNDCRPYYNLALHKMEQGKFDEAITLLTRAITIEPRFALAKIELAKAYSFAAYCLLDSCLTHVPEGHPLFANIVQFRGVLDQAVPKTYFKWIDRSSMPAAFRQLGKGGDQFLFDISSRIGEVYDVVRGSEFCGKAQE